MKPKQNLILTAGILILAISGNAIWLVEILYRFSWASLGWLYSKLYSPYLLAAFPAISFLLPFILSKRIGYKKIHIPFILLYFINLSFYHFGENLLRLFFGKFIFLLEPVLIFLLPPAIFLLFGLSYSIVVKYFVVNIRPRYFILFTLVIIPILPLSWLTYKILPVTQDTEWFFNAIKAGYPVFWTTLLMGLAGWLIEKRTEKTLQVNTP
jgi:hypothetical protein